MHDVLFLVFNLNPFVCFSRKTEPYGAGLRPTRTISLEEHRVGGTEISGLILTPSSLSLSLLANHALLESLELLQKSSSL